MSYYISKGDIQNFRNYLTQEEKSKGTIGKYLHDVAVFTGWLAGRELSREYVAGWKESLILANYAPVTIASVRRKAEKRLPLYLKKSTII